LRVRSPAVLFAIGVGLTLALALGVVIALLRTPSGGKAVSDNAPLIAAVIALGGVATAQMVSIALEDQRTQETRALEDRRIREARILQAQRGQDSALQAFYDTYGELRTAPAGYKRAILRAKMQTLLLQLDEKRKGVLLSFLHGAMLSRKKEITPYEERWRYPILSLDYIDFSRTKRAPDTKLTFDDLESIILRGAKLSEVNLSGANLKNADLRDADLRGAVLRKATPKDAEMIPGEFHTEVDKAKIDGKYPEGLMETDLSGAKLNDADLSDADLSGAVGITNEELEQQAKSLKGAIMPDGSKHP
jgi:Pentapeptide repeats (8 copies)